MAVTETVSWGVLYYGFTAFLQPISQDLGWSVGAISAAFSVALLCQGATALVVGRWLDHHSPRALMTAGSILATVGVLAWSQVRSPGQFVLLWAALGVVMATVLYEPAFTVITKWFVAGRRRALTAVTLVAGLASTIFLPLENHLIETYGWRRALVILAAILGGITIPLHAIVLRPPPTMATPSIPNGTVSASTIAADSCAVPDGMTTPDQPARSQPAPDRAVRYREVWIGRRWAASASSGRLATDGEQRETAAPTSSPVRTALRGAPFWYLTGAFVASSFVTSGLALHQISLLVQDGHSAAFAAAATGTLGAMQLPGRLLFAPLERRVSRRAMIVVVFGSLAVGVALLGAATNVAVVWAFVALYGMGRGMSTLLRATLVADLFGASHYGTLSGVLSACTTVATAAGPLVAGLMFDVAGNYTRVLVVLVVLAVVATALAARVERPVAGRPT